MKVNWMAAATLALATSFGIPLVATAQTPAFTVSDVVIDPVPAPPTDSVTSASDAAKSPMGTAPAVDLSAPAAAEAAPEEPCAGWSIMSMLDGTALGDRLACRKIKFSGNMAQSMTFNFDSPKDRFNGPTTWTDRSNEYQMNQLWFTAEKATDTSDKDWDLGGRVDTMYGTNYRWCTASGLEDGWNNGRQFYGLCMPNLYAEVAHCDWKVKIGHFVSPVGYFTIDTNQNFFNTIPYTYQYGEPFTHTGALATKKFNDRWTLGGGVTRGWDNFGSTFYGSKNMGVIGTATYTAENGGSLAYVNMWSNEVTQTNAGGAPFTGRYFQTLVFTRPLNESVTYIAQSDFGTQAQAVNNNTKSAQWYGLNQYLLYKQNDCVTWGANFEWFRDEDGYRVGSLLPTLGNQARGLPPGRAGYKGNFFQCTVGPRWSPRTNLTIRPNLRFDWYNGDPSTTGAGFAPYKDGQKNNQTILGTDVIFTF